MITSEKLLKKYKPQEIKVEKPKNKLLDLNSILFQQLENLINPNITQEEKEEEIKVSKQVVSISQTIINNANLLLQAKKYFDSAENSQSEISPLLSLNEDNNSEKNI